MLKISRNTIKSTEIQQFPVEHRFLKLPVEKYIPIAIERGVLGGELNPPQIALLNAVNSPEYRFICAAFSRRVGKTTVANMIAQLVALLPNCNVLIMSPNYSLSSISFELQRRYVKQFDLEITKDNTKERILELSNGSTIRMGSVSQADSVVGRSYDLILFDECALSQDGEDAFNIALRPTLDKPNSKAIFISTPRGKNNWFSRFYDRGWSPEYPNWVSMQCTWQDNPRAVETDILEAKHAMSRQEFEQEYMASFTSFAGQIYQFDTETQVQECNWSLTDCEAICGLDVGFRDATAACVILYNWREELYWVVEEYLASERTTDQHAEELLKLESKWDIQTIFVDAAAQQTRYDWAMNYGLSTTNANKSVLDGIARVQALVENKKIFVNPKCTQTLATLDQYRWDERESLTRERPVHDKYSHMADALRYALYSYNSGIGLVWKKHLKIFLSSSIIWVKGAKFEQALCY